MATFGLEKIPSLFARSFARNFSSASKNDGNIRINPDGCISELFQMRGVLFGRGIINKRIDCLREIGVRISDKRKIVCKYEQDPIHARSSVAAVHFSAVLDDKVSDDDILNSQVFVVLDEGIMVFENPIGDGRSNDAFFESEDDYWTGVRNSKNSKVLEIGSRARSGISRRGLFPESCDYVGFDIADGENVDVVGDAHKLSDYFPTDYFDFVFSVSVWEHLVMPWKVSVELNKVMKKGAQAMINTHQSWPSHEEPWDYFRFCDSSWDSLFNSQTGFRIIKRGTGVKCVMAPVRAYTPITANAVEWHYGYLATRCVVEKVGDTKLEWNVDAGSLTRGVYSH
jgi:hypothetical protein